MKDIYKAESVPQGKIIKSTTIIKIFIGLLFFTTIATMFFKAFEISIYNEIYSYSLADIIKLSKDSSSLENIFKLLSYFAKDIAVSIEALLDTLAQGFTLMIVASAILGLLCIFLKPMVSFITGILGAILNGGILLYIGLSAMNTANSIKERLSSMAENMNKLLGLFGTNIDFSSNLGENTSFILKPAPIALLLCLLLIVILSITGLIILNRRRTN